MDQREVLQGSQGGMATSGSLTNVGIGGGRGGKFYNFAILSMDEGHGRGLGGPERVAPATHYPHPSTLSFVFAVSGLYLKQVKQIS